MPHQLPPGGDWKTWVIMGGRGAGKTRAGAEWVRSEVEGSMPLHAGRSRRVALVGETIEQVVNVMIEGDSGLLACSPPDRRPVWQATRRRLVWPNGAEAAVFSAHDPERLRGPQFDAAWVDEIGCAAIDKGTNEPNKFLDPKSSESALPRYSNGRRDDLIQAQFLRASAEFWGDPTNNPVSPVYGGRMLDWSRAFVWAWDARPFPFFPANRALWSDGENYARGHWLNGRVNGRTLDSVVREICREAGVTAPDTRALHGFVRGYASSDQGTARALLQPLMLAYAADAIERDGALVWRSRSARQDGAVDPTTLAVSDEVPGRLEEVRLPEAEVSGRVRLTFVDADADYEVRAAEAVLADEGSAAVSQSEMPLVLTQSEGQAIAERWLVEARSARDRLRFALPPSEAAIGAGDVVRVGEGPDLYRVDAIERAEWNQCEAVRIERAAYETVATVDVVPALKGFAPTVPVVPVFLDLPLLSGDETPHAPWVAVSADPWPGAAAVYVADGTDGYALNTLVEQPSIIGVTETPLAAAVPGAWDRGAPLRVRVVGGDLSSAEPGAVLSGANLAAIAAPGSDDWEVFQFAEARLVGPDTYELSRRLRGQGGTDPLIPSAWPAGCRFVALNGALRQISLPASLRGIERGYRIGPASRSFDDASYVEDLRTFSGVGLRPYAPVHLRAARLAGGDLRVTWIRRTRIDGDLWGGSDVPLGESAELYLVRVRSGDDILRAFTVPGAAWVYSAADQVSDGLAGPFEIDVAQVSDRVGPGLFRRISIDD